LRGAMIVVSDHLKASFFELSPEASNIIRAAGAIIHLDRGRVF
jgi:hypothetical protein